MGRDSAVVNVIGCQSIGVASTSLQNRQMFRNFAALAPPSELSYKISTLTVHYWREDQTTGKMAGHVPSCTEAKKSEVATTLYSWPLLTVSVRATLFMHLLTYVLKVIWYILFAKLLVKTEALLQL